jgi:hypothetical protein
MISARRWYEGVIETDRIAPSMVDNVESDGTGTVRFIFGQAPGNPGPQEKAGRKEG